MAQQTRLGLYGGARQLYGSFAGKVPFVPPIPPPVIVGVRPPRLKIVEFSSSQRVVETDFTMSQRFRQTMKGLVNLQIETSSGSPEGRLAAKSGKLYQDTNNTVDDLEAGRIEAAAVVMAALIEAEMFAVVAAPGIVEAKAEPIGSETVAPVAVAGMLEHHLTRLGPCLDSFLC